MQTHIKQKPLCGHGVEVPQDLAVDSPLPGGTGGDCKNIFLGVFFFFVPWRDSSDMMLWNKKGVTASK